MEGIPPISRGLPPVVRATRPPVKRVERITRGDEHPEKEKGEREREERPAPHAGQEAASDGDERPHIDIRV